MLNPAPFPSSVGGTDPALAGRVTAVEEAVADIGGIAVTAQNLAQAVSETQGDFFVELGNFGDRVSALEENTGAPSSSRYVRRYLDTRIIPSSATWDRDGSLFDLGDAIDGVDLDQLEVDIECIGGGGSGGRASSGSAAGSGGSPGAVQWLRGVRFYDLPETVDVTVGAGAAGTNTVGGGNYGGSTKFGELLHAHGGVRGGNRATWDTDALSDTTRLAQHLGRNGQAGAFCRTSQYRPSGTDLAGLPGPGAGSVALAGQPGGGSHMARPEHALDYTASGENGASAGTHWQYGCGGGGGGGNGGWPGGGGASSGTATSGSGGDGCVRVHYYVWEPAT